MLSLPNGAVFAELCCLCQMMLSLLNTAELWYVLLNLLLRLNAGVYTGGRLGPLQIVAQYLKLHLYHQVCQNQPNYVKFKLLHKLSSCVMCVQCAPLIIQYSNVLD